MASPSVILASPLLGPSKRVKEGRKGPKREMGICWVRSPVDNGGWGRAGSVRRRGWGMGDDDEREWERRQAANHNRGPRPLALHNATFALPQPNGLALERLQRTFALNISIFSVRLQLLCFTP